VDRKGAFRAAALYLADDGEITDELVARLRELGIFVEGAPGRPGGRGGVRCRYD
jgi:hypothetical protein